GPHRTEQYFWSFTKTLGKATVNEIKAGYNSFEYSYQHNGVNGTFTEHPDGCNPRNLVASAGVVPGLLTPNIGNAPRITLRGYTLGTGTTHPHCVGEDTYQLRENLTLGFSRAGHHDLQFGAEYLYALNHLWYPQGAFGSLDASGGTLPADVIQAIFPVWNDWT